MPSLFSKPDRSGVRRRRGVALRPRPKLRGWQRVTKPSFIQTKRNSPREGSCVFSPFLRNVSNFMRHQIGGSTVVETTRKSTELGLRLCWGCNKPPEIPNLYGHPIIRDGHQVPENLRNSFPSFFRHGTAMFLLDLPEMPCFIDLLYILQNGC